MPDPFTVSLGVAQLIATSASAVGLCYRYSHAFKSAREEAKSLTSALQNLCIVLGELQDLIDDGGPIADGHTLAELIKNCQDSLDRVKQRLESRAPSDDQTTSERFWRKVKWPFDKSETLEHVTVLERHKSLLNLAVNTRTAKLVRSHNQDLTHLSSEIRHHFAEEAKAQERLAREDVLTWLSRYDYGGRQKHLFDALHEGTCQWVFDQSEYKTWQSSSRNPLWLVGSSGSGKTFTTSRVIDRLQRDLDQPERRVLFFFFDGNDASTRGIVHLLSAIISQYCACEDAVSKPVQKMYDACATSSREHHQPTLANLQVCLSEILSCPTTFEIAIVVDAVNEADDPSAIIDWANQLGRSRAAIKVFLSTINAPLHDLNAGEAIFFRIDTPGHTSDIDSYIEFRLNSMPKYQLLSGEMKDGCIFKLKENANGMFRWVQCQLEEIARAKSPKDLEKRLAALPRTLEEFYNDRLPSPEDDDFELFLAAIRLMKASPFPLKLTELAEATILRPITVGSRQLQLDDMHQPEWDARLFDDSDILKILGPFAHLEEATTAVSIAHHSVRTFFMEGKAVYPAFRFGRKQLHFDAATICLSYLTSVLNVSLSSSDTRGRGAQQYEALVQQYPLLMYCAKNWPIHVVESGEEQLLLPLIRLYFASQPTDLFKEWLEVLRLTHPDDYYVPARWSTDKNVAYHAISHGLTLTTEALLNDGIDGNSIGGSWGSTLLHAACWTERPQIVRLLLRWGVDYGKRNHDGDTAYDLLSYRNQRTIEDIFFEEEHNVEPSDLTDRLRWLPMDILNAEDTVARVSHMKCCSCGWIGRLDNLSCPACGLYWCLRCYGFVQIISDAQSLTSTVSVRRESGDTRSDRLLDFQLTNNDRIVAQRATKRNQWLNKLASFTEGTTEVTEEASWAGSLLTDSGYAHLRNVTGLRKQGDYFVYYGSGLPPTMDALSAAEMASWVGPRVVADKSSKTKGASASRHEYFCDELGCNKVFHRLRDVERHKNSRRVQNKG